MDFGPKTTKSGLGETSPDTDPSRGYPDQSPDFIRYGPNLFLGTACLGDAGDLVPYRAFQEGREMLVHPFAD